MVGRVMRRLALVFVAACGGGGPPGGGPDGNSSGSDGPGGSDGPAARPDLDVTSLGVQGFALRYGDDLVLTAPMFTRQSAVAVSLGLSLDPDTAATDAGLAGVDLANLRAVVSGHAHYDHFIDVAHVLDLAPQAIAYTNLSGRNILAALAPDRPNGCTNTPATPLARSRVIALDDALASHVDYTNCPEQRPPGAPLEGSWLEVPGSHVRIMAMCSMHPAQIGPIHFGEGSVDEEQCELPGSANGWLEGQTLALLIDWLDDAGKPALRVFYQDAPTNAPIGLVPPALLADRRVDVALLCVGSYANVENEPTAIIENLTPRFALSGHWEDFFIARDQPPQPIPLLDVNTFVQRAEAALSGPPDAPLLVDGIETTQRHVLVQPGAQIVVPGLQK